MGYGALVRMKERVDEIPDTIVCLGGADLKRQFAVDLADLNLSCSPAVYTCACDAERRYKEGIHIISICCKCFNSKHIEVLTCSLRRLYKSWTLRTRCWSKATGPKGNCRALVTKSRELLLNLFCCLLRVWQNLLYNLYIKNCQIFGSTVGSAVRFKSTFRTGRLLNAHSIEITRIYVNDIPAQYSYVDPVSTLTLGENTTVAHHHVYKSKYLTALREADEGELLIQIPRGCIKQVSSTITSNVYGSS